MIYVIIFLVVAGGTWLLLVKRTAAPPDIPTRKLYSEKFERLMAAPPPEEDECHKRPSDWVGEPIKPSLIFERELPYGARVELTAPIYEEAPYLWGLYKRFYQPRTGPRAERWEDELVSAPFAVHYPLYLDIVYQRELPGRRIKVKRIELGYQGFYLEAYCFLRQDDRRFRLDCVSALIDADGAVFESVDEWVKTLPVQP